MKKVLSVYILLMLISCLAWAQQDAQFSQYMFNGIYINPAYAGYKEQLNAHAFYRNQWTGVNGAPRTASLAIDAIANNGNVGLAFQISSDRIGAQKNEAAYGSYAYRLRMNEDGSSRLTFGLGIGVLQLGIDGALLNPNEQEVNQPFDIQRAIVPDARVGAFFANDKFYAGFSVDNLISQYIDIKRYAYIPQPKPHYYLTAGALVPLSTDLLLKPSFLLRDDVAGPSNIDLNTFLIISEKFWIGGAYRRGLNLYKKKNLQRDLFQAQSGVVAIQVLPSNTLRLGYSYDFSLDKVQNYGGGTHELSVSYFFNSRETRILSPRFF